METNERERGLDLDAIEARRGAAGLGPITVTVVDRHLVVLLDGEGHPLAAPYFNDICFATGDGEFIAHAWDDVPALAAEVRRLRLAVQEQAGEAHRLRRVLTTYQDMGRGDFWFWQGDGEDRLESLTCPVVIRPEVLAALLAVRDGASALRAPEARWLVADADGAQAYAAKSCEGETYVVTALYAGPGVIEALALLDAAWSRHHPECRFNVGPRTLTCHPECPEWNAELAAEHAEATGETPGVPHSTEGEPEARETFGAVQDAVDGGHGAEYLAARLGAPWLTGDAAGEGAGPAARWRERAAEAIGCALDDVDEDERLAEITVRAYAGEGMVDLGPFRFGVCEPHGLIGVFVGQEENPRGTGTTVTEALEEFAEGWALAFPEEFRAPEAP